MKKQIILIRGGDTFDTYEAYIESLKAVELDFSRVTQKRWGPELNGILGDEFDVVLLEMPNRWNAKYLEWKLWFDKHVPHFNDEVLLVGTSLGAIFLAKYLAENDFAKKIRATFLVAPPFDGEGSVGSLADFILPTSLDKIVAQSPNITIYFSKDDPVVPFDHLAKYAAALPTAKSRIFEDRKHFNQAEFPEIVEDIKEAFK